jgi:hypothetical protein
MKEKAFLVLSVAIFLVASLFILHFIGKGELHLLKLPSFASGLGLAIFITHFRGESRVQD